MCFPKKNTPLKFNMDPKKMVWKRWFLLNMAILGIHVSFQGCNISKSPCSMGNTFSNGRSSIVMLVFEGVVIMGFTLPKNNIASENSPFQKETPIPTIHLQVLS